MNLIQQGERELDQAQRDYHKAAVTARAARAKVEAAVQRLGELRFKAFEAGLEIERMRKEGELR